MRTLGGFVWLPLLVCGSCLAWDTPPHQRITQAALDALPKQFLGHFGSELKPLIEIYCILPDRYEEMEHYGFVRNSPGPKRASEIRSYCVRPDGQPIHGPTGDRNSDIASLVCLLDRIVASLAEGHAGEAARYAGVLSHFIEDSLSPPHAVSADQLLEMTPRSAQVQRINIHSAIERSVPDFTLDDRAPRSLGGDTLTAANAILDRCYEGAEMNRSGLSAIVKAASGRDERTLNEYRLRAGKKAAEILADALFTVLRIGNGVR